VRRERITIDTGDGERQVPAFIYNRHFAIHPRYKGKGWSVTHRKTGLDAMIYTIRGLVTTRARAYFWASVLTRIYRQWDRVTKPSKGLSLAVKGLVPTLQEIMA